MVHIITCAGCDKQFPANSRNRRVCSPGCRSKQRSRERAAKRKPQTCPHCNVVFIPRRKGQQFCTKAHSALACGVNRYWSNPEEEREKSRQKAALHRARRASENPETIRENGLRYRYGITVAEYDQLVLAQGRACAICTRVPSGLQGDRLVIDHDHELSGHNRRGEIRGLLCVNCNAGLGLLGDNAENLERALLYLRKNGSNANVA